MNPRPPPPHKQKHANSQKTGTARGTKAKARAPVGKKRTKREPVPTSEKKPIVITVIPAVIEIGASAHWLISFLSRAQSIREQRLTQAQRIAEKETWTPKFAAEIPLWRPHYAAAVTALAAGDPKPLFQVLSQFGPLTWGLLFSEPTVNRIVTDWWVDMQVGIKSQGRQHLVRLGKTLSRALGRKVPSPMTPERIQQEKEQNSERQRTYRTDIRLSLETLTAALDRLPDAASKQTLLTTWATSKQGPERQAAQQYRKRNRIAP